jgi:transposase
MIKIRGEQNIVCGLKPIDMRKSIDGLTMLVIEHLRCEPQESIFVFRNRGGDKVKLLYWDRNGFVVHYKRLEQGRFKWWPRLGESSFSISQEQLEWLLAGLDFCLMSEFSDISYAKYY